MMPLILAMLGRVSRLKTAYDAHAAATGSSVHGLGNVATQTKTAVDFDGGTMDGVVIGGGAVEAVDAKRVRESNNGMGSGTSFALDWAAYGAFKVEPSGAFTTTHSNLPASGKGQVVYLDIYFAGAAQTWSSSGVTWVSGSAPVLATGHNWIALWCVDGSTVWGSKLS